MLKNAAGIQDNTGGPQAEQMHTVCRLCLKIQGIYCFQERTKMGALKSLAE